MNTTDATTPHPPLPPHKSVPSPSGKKPGLLWRRLAAIAVDMLLFRVFFWICAVVAGTFIGGLFLAGFGFFVLWYMMILKRESTVGTALAGIAIRQVGSGMEKSPRILLRFAVTWIPVFFIFLHLFESGTEEQLPLAIILVCVSLLWYAALLIGMVATNGKGGIQDAICKSEAIFHIAEPLSAGRKTAIWICIALMVADSGVGVLSSGEDSDYEAPEDSIDVPVVTGASLAFESLKLSAHTVNGRFRELDLLEDDEAQWNGTACVLFKDEGKLYLVSNRHVLGLGDLAQSDDLTDMMPEINAYALTVTFASGKEVPVLLFGDLVGTLDLALLQVDAAGLVEGRDYVTVPYDESVKVRIGDEAVAVGSPRGLDGTHTFGKISAVRDLDNGGASGFSV